MAYQPAGSRTSLRPFVNGVAVWTAPSYTVTAMPRERDVLPAGRK